jgi:hypothetical protein
MRVEFIFFGLYCWCGACQNMRVECSMCNDISLCVLCIEFS